MLLEWMNEDSYIYKAVYVYGLPIIGGNCYKYYLCLLWQNMSSVATKVCLPRKNLLWQNYVYCDTIFLSWWKMCFVATNTCLLQQNFCCCHKYHFCCDKTFVAIEMILTAAPANDTSSPIPPILPHPPHPPPSPPSSPPSPYTQLLLPRPCDNNSYFKCCVLQGSK